MDTRAVSIFSSNLAEMWIEVLSKTSNYPFNRLNILDAVVRLCFPDADCSVLLFGELVNQCHFLTVDFLLRCNTSEIWGRAAGTNLVYKVHQVVNISSSGFGSNICDLFSLRPEMPFVCQGRIVLEVFFFTPSLFLLFFQTSSYSFGTLKNKKGEACEGSWEECQVFPQISVVKEGCLSFLFLCPAIKTSVELLPSGSWWVYISLVNAL